MSEASKPHSISAQDAIKTLRGWDHLGTANHLYYTQAIDNLEEQLEALQREHELAKKVLAERFGFYLNDEDFLASLDETSSPAFRPASEVFAELGLDDEPNPAKRPKS